ncbi:MAG: NAD(P)/FAD-dependent oxidoreductase [Pseudomonadota bacterium]
MGSGTEVIDVLIIGAGAAGLFCGARAAERGLSVQVVDHAKKPAEKVRISGGGRCNFTNLHTEPSRFISENPYFAKSALARYTPADFLDHLRARDITWREKKLGQLFCDEKSTRVIRMLLDDLETAGGELRLGVRVGAVEARDDGYAIETSQGRQFARNVVIATGGLSIPKMGATGYAYDVARAFGHRIVTPRPALVPFTLSGRLKETAAALSGVACDARIATADGTEFDEAILFTHRGLSGPAVLQASSYWKEGEPVTVNLAPNAHDHLQTEKENHPNHSLARALEATLPARLVGALPDLLIEDGPDAADLTRRLGDIRNARLSKIDHALTGWTLRPAGTEGWRTAEVTTGGVSVDDISSRTMESKRAAGLYFIGECVDVTGWLGGYNFQWAWASAAAAAEALGA